MPGTGPQRHAPLLNQVWACCVVWQSVGVQVLDSWVGLAGDLPLGLFGSSPAEMLRSSGGLEMMMMMPGGGVEGAEEGGKAGGQQARDLGVADTFLKVRQAGDGQSFKHQSFSQLGSQAGRKTSRQAVGKSAEGRLTRAAHTPSLLITARRWVCACLLISARR